MLDKPSMTSIRGLWIISSIVMVRVRTSWKERAAAWGPEVAIFTGRDEVSLGVSYGEGEINWSKENRY